MIGSHLRPMPGERECGDRCAWWRDNGRLTLLVADGLGHGPEAAVAAQAAVDCVARQRGRSLTAMFEACDRQLHDTRGAALALALVEGDRLTLASVGNIRAVLVGRQHDLRLGGVRGIIGAGYDGLRPETLPLACGDWLALYSDGFPELLPLRELLIPSPPRGAENPETAFCLESPTPGAAQTLAQEALARWASPRDDAALLLYRHGPAGCQPSPCRRG